MFIILYLSNTYHMPGLLERNLDDDTYSGYVYENKAENTKQMTEVKLREKFKDIIADTDKKGEVIHIPVLNLFDYTDSVNENCVDSFCPNMYGQFSLGLEWILRKRNALDQVDRIKDFSDDRDYMNYLHSNNLELLIGSKYVLANKNYSLTHEFEKLTENWKVIYTMLMENGLALKRDSIKVWIHSIEVEIRSQNISDEKQSYNKETGLYTYSIYSGMPIDFKENELEAFLHDNRKVIEISAKISVQTATERIGTLIVEK